MSRKASIHVACGVTGQPRHGRADAAPAAGRRRFVREIP
ncbi:hypothetical protein AZ22_3076 [Bordetella bronchiseptica 980-2]|nr:hypothetical protein AZ22_3076 [Bordetella bronchiseptica 980-2]KCV61243.1 hypothetical protein AZ14_3133 [Bordetella bronchiseptica 980]KDB65163.1 hypothetical protein AZ15_3184 [Bordetella bronchiseptica A1-7]KDB89109.1 hypothetical protein AZ27_3026 [Bordetella bronchiseptica D756]KDB89595.1 hypothetical protein AZ17_3183 [Bordetella bronchiseptica D989]KDB94479.1 hypothetical protein AZ23_3131 [Bordetella bronchiseptica E010]KDC00175.1 hypothetical protein AZ18_3160 [Bordetella bronchi